MLTLAGCVLSVWPATVNALQPKFDPPDDPALLSLVYANFNIGTAEEMRLAYTTNTPGAEIEACMVERGFDYESWDELEDDPRWTMSPEEYAATYGFGIVVQERGAYPLSPDPNAEYLNSLSAGQQDAYFRAEAACRLGPDAEERVRYFNAFAVAFEDFSGEVHLDDRAAEALETWQTCLADAGYEFESPQQMRESFYIRLGSADLDELQREEITMAIANVSCEAAYTGHAPGRRCRPFRRVQGVAGNGDRVRGGAGRSGLGEVVATPQEAGARSHRRSHRPALRSGWSWSASLPLAPWLRESLRWGRASWRAEGPCRGVGVDARMMPLLLSVLHSHRCVATGQDMWLASLDDPEPVLGVKKDCRRVTRIGLAAGLYGL